MVDPTSIVAVVNGLKAATDIAKTLREMDISLEKAEAKMKLADLVSALADAKVSAADAQLLINDKDRQIRELQEALETKANLVRHGEAYYLADGSEDSDDGPYCLRCWEVDHRLVHTLRDPVRGAMHKCPECKAGSMPGR